MAASCPGRWVVVGCGEVMLSQSSPLRTGGATEAGGRTSPVELASRGARCCRCAARCDAMRGVERPRCGEMGLRRRKEFKLACADDAGKWASERSGRRNVGGRHVTGPRTHRALSQVTPPRSAERLGRERHCRRSAPQIGGAGGPTLGGGGKRHSGRIEFRGLPTRSLPLPSLSARPALQRRKVAG